VRSKSSGKAAKAASNALSKPGKRVPAVFFRTESGREPVREWLKELPYSEDRKRIGEDIKTVEFWVANRNARLSLIRRGTIRGSHRSYTQSDCESPVLRRQEKPNGLITQLYEEDTKDAQGGFGACAVEQREA
jgi:hypothetical protein